MGVPKRVDKWWIGWQNRLANIDLVSVIYMRGVDIVLSQIQQGQGQARGGREREDTHHRTRHNEA